MTDRIADNSLAHALRLSLCMIVRDNEDTIEAALAGISPWVDEIVIVDTGSTDRTPEICKRYGARLFHFPWCDDFSAARNESLKHARGEWIFYLDSDDVIDAAEGLKLRRLIQNRPNERVGGFILQVRCPSLTNSAREEITVADQLRLFRNHPQIRFCGRVHEQALTAVRELGKEVEWSDIAVRHAPPERSAEAQRRKTERDLRLSEIDLQERPDDPLVWLHLGMSYQVAGDFPRAVAALRDCLRCAAARSSETRKAHSLLVRSLMPLGALDEAESACRCGRERYPDDPELLFLEGTLAHHRGDAERAERAFLAALTTTPQPYFRSLDTGVRGYKSRHNLGVIYAAQSRLEEAETQWRQAIAECPTFRDAWQGLGEMLFRQERLEELEKLADQLVTDPELSVLALLWQARIAGRKGRTQQAGALLQRAVEVSHGNADAVQLWCRFLAGEKRLVDAEPVLQAWIEQSPEDVRPRYWLAHTLLETGETEGAIDQLQEALRLQPRFDAARELLTEILTTLGRDQETGSFQQSTMAPRTQQEAPQTRLIQDATR